MRLAMLGTSLFHQGAEYVLATLARGMAERGYGVTVVLSKCHADWQREHPDWKPFELGDKVKVIILPERRARKNFVSLRRIINAGQYDAVISHSGPYSNVLSALAYSLKRRPAFIHVEHLGGIGTDMRGNRVDPHFSIKSFIVNRLMRGLDAQFAVSQGTAEAIARMTGYPRERIYTVYNPALDQMFWRKMSAIPEHPLLFDDTMPTVVAAGAFSTVKNHVLLLRAWATVVKRVKARLIIFGDGTLRGEYDRLICELGIGDTVSLPGFTNNLPAALKRADCFVVSSFVESFSVVLVEALASGVPVVATDCPYGPREILADGKYGILVENNNEQALADGILGVLNGKGLTPPPESYERFTIDAIVDRYEQAINDVCKKHKA